jgi:YD repeat-containing protein
MVIVAFTQHDGKDVVQWTERVGHVDAAAAVLERYRDAHHQVHALVFDGDGSLVEQATAGDGYVTR